MDFSETIYLISLSLIIATAILFAIFCKSFPSPRYPPGTNGLPILGVLPYISPYPQRVFKKWSLEKYGPIFSTNVFGHKQVVVNTYDTLEEAYIQEGVATSGRFDSFLFGKLQGNNGITFVDYTHYVETQTEFGLKFLNAFGRNGMDNFVNDELEYFFKSLEPKLDKPSDIYINLFDLIANVTYKIVCGRRYEYGDDISKIFSGTFESIFGYGGKGGLDTTFLFVIELQPFMRFIPPFRFAYNRYLERTKPAMDFIKSFIKETKENLDRVEGTFFVKEYLKEAQRRKDKDDEYNDVQLVAYARDHFGGIKNTSTTLRWMLLCALRNPESHRKVVQEIDEVLGKDKIPASDDRSRMPITCAFIEEVFRLCSPLPKPLEARLLQDIRLGEYIIPRNVELSGNFWGANHDPETWPEPDKFDPFRHIDEEGKLKSPSKVMQYLIGKRRCYGEMISNALLFLSFARLLQKYELSAPEGAVLPTIEDGIQGITYDSKEFEVVLKKRCYTE